ncbi:hypothetical protein ACWEOE_40385 [Amycolatopsis sp. NPDC004368]
MVRGGTAGGRRPSEHGARPNTQQYAQAHPGTWPYQQQGWDPTQPYGGGPPRNKTGLWIGIAVAAVVVVVVVVALGFTGLSRRASS